MTDELLPYYQQELAWFRRLATDFAEAHPKIAGRLRLDPDGIGDPHVSRLVESFALLTARVRRKLDDDFPELTHALLEVLYPHYLAPVPSAAILQMAGAPDQAGPFDVPAGTSVDTAPLEGESCRYGTCYPVRVWPVDVESAQLTGQPLVAPRAPFPGAVASLRIVLGGRTPEVKFSSLLPESFRFYLSAPPDQAYALHELLLNDVVGVAIASGPDDAEARFLPASAVRPVGYGVGEGLLPYPPNAFPGYRVLTEYFAFPQKFLFVDVAGLPAEGLARFGGRLEIYLYLRRPGGGLEPHVSAGTFALGCTPVVNLFRQRAEPIHLTQTRAEYRVVPDARRPFTTEVWSVDRVDAVSRYGEREPCLPFFCVRHGVEAPRTRYFTIARRAAERFEGRPVVGTDVAVSLRDLDLQPDVPADWVLDAEVTCLNRDLPARLPFGPDQPKLQLEGGFPARTVRFLTRPTPTRRTPPGHGTLWRLVSHLALNQLSVAGGDGASDALREILRLYDYLATDETRKAPEGIVAVSSVPVVARLPGPGPGAIARGTEIRLELDPLKFSGGGAYLFASVLERFFAQYCSVNSFTRTTVTLRGREGELRRWPPRAGETVLV